MGESLMQIDIKSDKKFLSYDESLEFFEKLTSSLFNHRFWDNIISKDKISLTMPSPSPSRKPHHPSLTFNCLEIDFKDVDPLARKKTFDPVLLNFTLAFDLLHSCSVFHKNVSNNSAAIVIRGGLLVPRSYQKYHLCLFDNRLGFVPKIESPLTIEIAIAMLEEFINHTKRFVKKRQETWDACGLSITYPQRRTSYFYEGIVLYNYNNYQLPDITNGIKIY